MNEMPMPTTISTSGSDQPEPARDARDDAGDRHEGEDVQRGVHRVILPTGGYGTGRPGDGPRAQPVATWPAGGAVIVTGWL